MLALRCKGTRVIWHGKVTWRQKGGYSGNNNNTGGSDMGDMCHRASWGRRKEM
jgi:hypothetical protein